MQHWDRIERCPFHLNHIPWLKILKIRCIFLYGELFINFDEIPSQTDRILINKWENFNGAKRQIFSYKRRAL
jgi:hypothetical protein